MEQRDLQRTLFRRSRILTLIVVIVGFAFMGRLFYLQVIKHEHYKQLALEEHQSKFSIPASRGEIYAYDGEKQVPLVLNQKRPTIYADPRFIDDKDKTADKLSEPLSMKKDEIKELLETESAYVVIKKKISEKVADEIKEMDIDGIGFTDASYRVYPQGQLASQILGFVNDEGVGQYGVEDFMDEDLNGTAGRLKAITDVFGIPITSSDDNIVEDPINGDRINLTIDLNVQRLVEDAVKEGVKKAKGKSGSAIVMDPHTGSIIAMANYPSYNPEQIDKVKDYEVFKNVAVDSPYETGSGMKIFTMSTGLNTGSVTENQAWTNTGVEVVDGHKIENAGPSPGVSLHMPDIIQYSINTGVVHVLKQLGGGEINKKARETLHEYFTKRFGFGSKTGIELSNEADGVVIEPTTGAGDNIRYANMTFGQGITVTMLQMVSAASSVLNGGTYYQPRIIDSTIDADGNEHAREPQAIRKNVVSSSTSESIKKMMKNVVEGGGGTIAKKDGYFLGGKTGTAQIPDEFGTYTENREIGSFLGFGASKDVDFVIMTRVDEPQIYGYAGTVAAAPIFAVISDYLIEYYQIPPNN